jgi:streptogramin lyase
MLQMIEKTQLWKRPFWFLMALCILISIAQPAHADATIVVSDTCSLIDAITAANTDTATGGCPAGDGTDTIELETAVTYILTLVNNASIEQGGNNGLPRITSEIVINGNGATIARDAAAPLFRLFEVEATGDLTLNDVTLQGGDAGASSYIPGAIGSDGNVTLNHTVFTQNRNAVNADVLVVNDSTMYDNYGAFAINSQNATISHSTFSNNEERGISSGTLSLNHSTVSGHEFGVTFAEGSVNNSTVSGNEFGIVILSAYDEEVNATIQNSTVTGNTAGGIIVTNLFLGDASHITLNLKQTLVAGNTGDGSAYEIDNQLGGVIIADNYNLIGTEGDAHSLGFTPSDTDLVPSEPLADILDIVLQNNGGATATHALADNSPALDAIPTSDCATAADQRDVSRPQGSGCDIGAYERQTGSITIVKDAAPADGTDFAFTTDLLATGNYLFQWGDSGSGNGQLQNPIGIATDASGNIYIADTNNHRIQKFDSNGTYLAQWGSLGSGDGQFNHPTGVAVDSTGNVYVVDGENNRIQKFDSNGLYLAQWGTSGSGDGQFTIPQGIAVDIVGNVYVVDTFNDRIQKFDNNGTYLTQWGGYGTGDGQFYYPLGIAVDSAGSIYVADGGNNRIQKFDSHGTYQSQWGSYGFGNGQFREPVGLAVDRAGNVYVSDNTNGVQRFDSNGMYLSKWGKQGAINDQLSFPSGIVVNASGIIYVTDGGNNRVQVFGSNVFSLDDAVPDDGDTVTDSRVISDLLPGSYTFTETVTAGWALSDLACDSGNWSVNDSSVTVNLSAGEAILCTFTNGIEVTNQLPTVLNDVYSTNEGTQLDVTVPGVLGNDSDADGDGLTAVLVDDTSNGILTLNADGSFSYLPNPGFTGDDSFTYVANDGMGDSELATVTITVEMPASGPTCQGIPATIVGTDGHDFLTGTSGDDVIVGLNGNDIIRGKGGNDLICGDAGEDWLIGGSGQDKVYGGDGWDTLLGNAGDDELYGESGTDWLDGGLGADWLDGGLNDDVCHGGAHTDTAVNCEAVYSIP